MIQVLKFNMNRKSQVSVFVILSVIILVLGTYIVLSYNEDQRLTINRDVAIITSDPRIGLVQDFVEECLKLEVKEQLYFNQLSGGYYEIPPIFAYDAYLTVPFYVYDSEEKIPSIQEFERQLELAVNDNIDFCINNLEDYEIFFEEITVGEFDSSMLIQDGTVLASLHVPINLLNNNSGESSSLERFQVEVESDILRYFNLINEFISLHNGDFSRIPLSDLNILAYRNDFRFESKPQNFDVAIYNFMFEEFGRETPAEFQFAIKYDWRFD